jgi:hypothetical protein
MGGTLGRIAGGKRLVHHALDVGGSELCQRDTAQGWDKVEPDDLLIAAQRPGADGPRHAVAQPYLEEVACCLALAGQGKAVAQGALGELETARDLLPGPAIEGPSEAAPISGAERNPGLPAAVTALGNGAFSVPASTHEDTSPSGE